MCQDRVLNTTILIPVFHLVQHLSFWSTACWLSSARNMQSAIYTDAGSRPAPTGGEVCETVAPFSWQCVDLVFHPHGRGMMKTQALAWVTESNILASLCDLCEVVVRYIGVRGRRWTSYFLTACVAGLAWAPAPVFQAVLMSIRTSGPRAGLESRFLIALRQGPLKHKGCRPPEAFSYCFTLSEGRGDAGHCIFFRGALPGWPGSEVGGKRVHAL